jgi:hypothetical protein
VKGSGPMTQDNERGEQVIDLTSLERELSRLPDVSAARIVADDGGRPVEVHVLAATDKHPKQIVRDIQSVAMASFGIDLDRRVVSVVRLDSGAEATRAEPRTVLKAVVADQQGQRALIRVALERNEHERVGVAEGSLASTARLRLAAAATIDALCLLFPGIAVDLEMAAVLRSVEREIAVVTVTLAVSGHEEIVTGSALVREGGDVDAIVRAVLDATNRRLPALAPSATR